MDQQPDKKSKLKSTTRDAMRGALTHRKSHRQRAHDQAHDTEDSSHSSADPLVITTQAQLDACVRRLADAKLFAFDTEFIGELTYRPQLCLIQVAIGEDVELIDAQAPGLDLAPFWALMTDASIAKVVHAGEQDLQHVWRFTGQPPQNVFDTQIAGGFVSLGASTSLAKLTLEVTGNKIAKGFTLTDWSRRPLSASQLRYAVDDVKYLCEIYKDMKARVEAAGHLDWVHEECALRCEQDRADHVPANAFNRVRGYTSLEPKQMGMMRELAAWREVAAKEADLPPRSLVRDEVLVEIVRRTPASPDRLGAIKGMPHPVVNHYAADIFRAIQVGKTHPVVEPVPSPETDDSIRPSEKFRLEMLWGLAHVVCSAKLIDLTMVASKKDIQDYAYKLSRNLSVADSMLAKGWRKTLLGEPIRQWLNSGGNVNVAWKDGQIQGR
jgi:ribonuclease D